MLHQGHARRARNHHAQNLPGSTEGDRGSARAALDAQKLAWCVVAASILEGTTLCSATAALGESFIPSSKTW